MPRKKIPFFRFYPSDFMGGVRGMSAQEVGLYTMLLCRMYEESGPIEDHALRLATYCGMREKTFTATLEKLIALGKIKRRDGTLFNDRAESEISDRSHDLENAIAAGKASAKKRQQNQSQTATDVQRAFNHTDTDTDKEDTDTNVSVTRAKPKARKVRIGEDAQITDGMRNAADKRGHSQQEAEAQFERFKNDALAKAKTFADWNRAFVTWLDSPYFKPITTKGTTNGKRDGEAAERARRAGERWAARTVDFGEDRDAAGPLFSAGQPLRITRGSD
jgi:uncharacterized protein YdaU (DUF1376 family)